MSNRSVLIRVPATVGNFAGAKDSAALALDASLNVKVTPRLDGHVSIRYFGENGERVPRDRSNLVVRAMEAALHLKQLEFTGADLEIYSSVPVGVGLGSSTAAVLAGLFAADQLFQLSADEKTLFDLAEIYESRGDNLRAALYGGFVACVRDGAALAHRRTVVPESFALSVVVPETPLVLGEKPAPRALGNGQTSSERASEPKEFNLRRAAALAEFFSRPENGSGGSASLEAPLPPVLEKSVPGLEAALQVRGPGVQSVFVCGSGPAVAIYALEKAAEAVQAVRECFARGGVETATFEFRPTNAGAAEWNAVRPEITLPPIRGLGAPFLKSNLLPV